MQFQSITLERGPCYGWCPVYRVTVQKGGSVEWVGRSWVDEVGERAWSVSPEMVARLERALDKAAYLGLNPEYTETYVTCLATVTVTVVLEDGEIRRVEHYQGDESAPKELKRLQNRIDKLVGTAAFVGSGGHGDK